MNSSKKIMNKQKDVKRDKKASAAKGSTRISRGPEDIKKIIISGIFIVIVLVLCIGVGVQQLKPKVALTVNDTKLTLNDMMYPIYERESLYMSYDQMYQYYTGSSVWENTYMGEDRNVDSSLTNSEGLKQEIINSETAYEVLYREAVNAEYTLSDEDKDQVKESVSEALKGLSWSQKLKLNISGRKLTKRFEKRMLADNYMTDQQETLNKDVDEDKAIADISKKEYRQYDVQYYAVSTNSTDADGNAVKLSDKKKEELLKKLEKVADKAKDAKDFTTLIDEKEEDITYDKANFTEKEGWPLVTTKKILNEIKAMEKDEISEIYEDKKSGNYIFVKMIDNNSSESYNKACDTAIEDAQNAVYDEWYQGILPNYTVEQNMDVWNDIVIGTVTTEIVTIEDLEKMNAEDSSDVSGSSGE